MLSQPSAATAVKNIKLLPMFRAEIKVFNLERFVAGTFRRYRDYVVLFNI